MSKAVLVILLLIVTGVTTYIFWLAPEKPKLMPVSLMLEPEEAPARESETGEESRYKKVKREIIDWLDIAGKAVPVLSLLVTLGVIRKKK